MDAEQIWREMLEFFRQQDGVSIPANARAERLAAQQEPSVPLCLTLSVGNSKNKVRAFVRYNPQHSLMDWTAQLLEKKKDCRKLMKLLRGSGERALEFFALGETFPISTLRLEEGGDGPQLCAVQDVAWGVNTDMCAMLLREMRWALLLREKIQGALSGSGSLEWSLDEFFQIHDPGSHARRENDAAVAAEDARHGDQHGGSAPDEAADKKKKMRAEVPQRVLDINEALLRGDLAKARLLASGRDIFDVPDAV